MRLLLLLLFELSTLRADRYVYRYPGGASESASDGLNYRATSPIIARPAETRRPARGSDDGWTFVAPGDAAVEGRVGV